MHLRTYLQFSQIIYVIRYNLAIPTKKNKGRSTKVALS